MNTGTCKSCGKQILWIRTRTGRSMPCDTKPVNYRKKQKVTSQINLERLAGGAFAEKLNEALMQVAENIQNPNTEATTKRQINIAIKFAPNKSRQVINTQISVTTKLAATEAIDTQMVMGVNIRTGQIEIAEYDGQIRGQMNLSDFAEEEPQKEEAAGQQEAEPAEAEREQDIPTGAPIDMRRRKPEPRQQAEADPDPEAAGRLIPGKDFDPVTGEIYEPEDDRRTDRRTYRNKPKGDRERRCSQWHGSKSTNNLKITESCWRLPTSWRSNRLTCWAF